jgi:hypothetical protein
LDQHHVQGQRLRLDQPPGEPGDDQGPLEERETLLATAPGVYEAGWATKSSAWVRVQLELADPEEVFELLEEAWRMTATKRAINAYDEALGA